MKALKLGLNSYILKKEPVSIIHFITNRCNARCKHCFIDFNNSSLYENELSLQEIELLTKNVGNSLFNVNLTGGEPFLRKDLFEIASFYFKNAQVESVFISTNGSCTEAVRQFIERFRTSGIKGKLIFSISIDNFEKEHDNNRKLKGLFKNAIKTYQLISSYNNPGIMTNIGITVANHNYDKVIPLYEHLMKIGIKAFTATIMREEGVIKRIDYSSKKRIVDAYVKLAKLIHEDQLSGKTTGFSQNLLQGLLMNSKNMIANNIIAKTYLSRKFISQCSAGSLFGVIYANGDVYPCEILGGQKLGNLRDYGMDFMRLWNSKKARQCRRFIKDSKCNCTFECAWSINIISTPKFILPLLSNAVRMKKWKRKKQQ